MKKVTLLLMSLMLLVTGSIKAESGLPVTSDENGPWYYIQVLGSADDRGNRYWTVDKRTSTNFTDTETYRVFGEHTLATSFEAVEKQLFRFVELGGGKYQIINKSTDLSVDLYNWTAKNQPVATLSETPSTDWIIEEQLNVDDIYPEGAGKGNVERPGYYRIMPEINDLYPSYMYAHQGNKGFEYSVVFEKAQWGVGPNSSFHFIEYKDPGLLSPQTTPEKNPNFKYRAVGSDPLQNADTIQVLGFPSLTSDIEITYDTNNPYFIIQPKAGWDNRQGGVIEIWFDPVDAGEHSMPITISAETAEGPVSLEILIEGIALERNPDNFKPSPTLANSENDVWYSIQFYKRTGNLMKDMGVGNMLEGAPGYGDSLNDPTMLWKFVSIANNDTAYVLVNKAGNQLVYHVETIIDEETGDESTIGRFNSAATSDNTFSFNVGREDGARQIQWNEYYVDLKDEDGNPTGEKENRRTYINKTNTDNGFTQYNSFTDGGNSIKLYEYGVDKFTDSTYPKTSTASAPVWYYMQFSRAIAKTDADGNSLKNLAVQSQGIGTEEEPAYLVQTEIDADKADTSLYWRFEGEWNNFRVIDYDGNELGVTDYVQSVLVESGTGAAYVFEQFGSTTNWVLHCLDGTNADGRIYLNDFKNGENGDFLVGGYTKGDGGAQIVLTKVEDYDTTVGIDGPATDEIDGIVVGYVYYTLQGIQLATAPQTEGLYIQKTIYSNKKATAKTIYITK